MAACESDENFLHLPAWMAPTGIALPPARPSVHVNQYYFIYEDQNKMAAYPLTGRFEIKTVPENLRPSVLMFYMSLPWGTHVLLV